MPAHSLLFSKSTKRAARLHVPIRRTNRYQQYYMPSQHTYCGMVWNLIQASDVQSSPEVENFQIKIYYPAGDRTPDLLNQRQTCYHQSQRCELTILNVVGVFGSSCMLHAREIKQHRNPVHHFGAGCTISCKNFQNFLTLYMYVCNIQLKVGIAREEQW